MSNNLEQGASAASGLPPWRARLRGARQREGRQPTARWLQLGTVAIDGSPRVRTLVFRGWDGPHGMELYTDSRSTKCDELRQQTLVELCWLLPKARHQYRLRGSIAQQPDSVSALRWQNLSPKGRALWGWPAPGQPFDPSASFTETLDDSVEVPDNFLVLRVEIVRVELLDLTCHPHDRLVWTCENNWQEQRLNP